MRAIANIRYQVSEFVFRGFECGEEEYAAGVFLNNVLVFIYLVAVEWNSLTLAAVLDENPAAGRGMVRAEQEAPVNSR